MRILLISPGGARNELWGAPADAVVELNNDGRLPESLDPTIAAYIQSRITVVRCDDCYGDGYDNALEECDACLGRGWNIRIRA